MKEISLKELDEKINKNKLVFIVFYTVWCGDCKLMWPFLEKLRDENKDVIFYQLDAEKVQVFQSTNTPYKVLKVPTMILYRDGKEIARGYEFIPYYELQNWIDKGKKGY